MKKCSYKRLNGGDGAIKLSLEDTAATVKDRRRWRQRVTDCIMDAG